MAEEDEDYTPIFNALPSVMFVGLGEELAQACAKGCDPVLVLKVAHAAAALARMVATHPLLLILGARVKPDSEEEIRQHAVAIGAEVLLERDLQLQGLDAQLGGLVRQSMRARERRSL